MLIISNQEDDLVFGQTIANQKELFWSVVDTKKAANTHLCKYPNTLVFWDADQMSAYDNAWECLLKVGNKRNIIAITKMALWNYPELLKYHIFDHHLLRRDLKDNMVYYFNLVENMLLPSVASKGLADFFPATTKLQKITIKNYTHKKAATDAIDNHLRKTGIATRLASLAARSIDELLLNAIFDAPVNDQGVRVRWTNQRHEPFVMTTQEHVDLELAGNMVYVGACVTDCFGSLEKATIIKSLSKRMSKEKSAGNPSASDVGLGLRAIFESGLSLMYILKKKQVTKAMIFFPPVSVFKEFRTAPQFLSILTEDAD